MSMEGKITEWTFKEYCLYMGENALAKDQFKAIAKHLDHTSGKEKDRHLFQQIIIEKNYELLGEEFLFKKIKIYADDESFILGLEANDNFSADMILNFLINKEKQDQIESFKKGFDTVLKPLQDEQERSELINREIEFIETEAEIGRTNVNPRSFAFYLGFDNESRRVGKYQFKAPLTYETYRKTLEGAAGFHYVKYLKSLIVENDDEVDHPVLINGLLFPKKVAHKILLLDELGIIQTIRDKYPNADQTTIAKILIVILGLDPVEDAENVRKSLSKLHTNAFRNPSAMNKVKTITSQFG
jgi:hypothetical protein